MKTPRNRCLDLPLERRALLALRAAVKEAIAERRRQGLPVYVWRDGKVVDIGKRRPRSPGATPATRRRKGS